MILVSTMHGRLRRHRARQDQRAHGAMLDEEPAAALDTALQGDQGSLTLAAGWPMASPVFNQGRNHTANPGRERRRRARSEHTGIAVKCRRNPGQVFQESPSST